MQSSNLIRVATVNESGHRGRRVRRYTRSQYNASNTFEIVCYRYQLRTCSLFAVSIINGRLQKIISFYRGTYYNLVTTRSKKLDDIPIPVAHAYTVVTRNLVHILYTPRPVPIGGNKHNVTRDDITTTVDVSENPTRDVMVVEFTVIKKKKNYYYFFFHIYTYSERLSNIVYHNI